ncbi:3-keto-steroid reductase [Elsinoe australis]|uniref:3-keto-steroid reductase n=1 Tax=Elsinoe australis TaxID=40998 RepID=A0A2P7YC31_9PEZI|nr:3-keto-steroid reductase [Elsinoe australis]
MGLDDLSYWAFLALLTANALAQTRVNDTSLWNRITQTTIQNGISKLTIDPLGYYWAGPSGTPHSMLPAIPTNAPHAFPNGLAFACDASGVCVMDAVSDTTLTGTVGSSSSSATSGQITTASTNTAPVISSATSTSFFITDSPNGTTRTIDSLVDSSTTKSNTLSPSTSFPTESSSRTGFGTADSLTTGLSSSPSTGPITVGPTNRLLTAIVTISGTITADTITPGGAIWVVPTLPSLFPQDIGPVGPPSGAPEPSEGGSSSPDPLCLFGCGPSDGSGKGGGGSSFPCVINCSGGGGGGGGGSDGKPTDSKPTNSNGPETTIRSSTDELKSSTSSCTTTAAPTCDETVFLTTSYYSDSSSSTIISSTSTRCVTITACDARATTATVTSSTSTSETEYVCAPTVCASNCVRKRGPTGPAPTDAYKCAVSLVTAASSAAAIPQKGRLTNRELPGPSVGESADKFISCIFDTNQVRGAGSHGPPLMDEVLDMKVGEVPTSRFDAFGDEPFSAGVDGLFGWISVVVVSRKGVWTSHFRGNSFKEALSGSIDEKAKNQIFTDQVIDPLSKRDSRFKDFLPLTGVPENAFAEQEHPQLLIVSSSSVGKGGPEKYARPVNAILEEVNRLVPGTAKLGASTKWTYKAVSPNDFRTGALKGNARGKAITFYDPLANKEGAAGFQVWAETEVVTQDMWGGSCNEQSGSASNNASPQRRQVGGSCSLSDSPSGTTASASSGQSETTLSTSVVTTPPITKSTASSYRVQIVHINGWAGAGGSSLFKQEQGCERIWDWKWETDCEGGKSQVSFNLGLAVKAGCVERAIHSAGGPNYMLCEGHAIYKKEDELICKASPVKLGAMIEQGLDLERKVRVADLMVTDESALVKSDGGGTPSVTTPHILAQPGNTAAAAAFAAEAMAATASSPASASATTTFSW